MTPNLLRTWSLVTFLGITTACDHDDELARIESELRSRGELAKLDGSTPPGDPFDKGPERQEDATGSTDGTSATTGDTHDRLTLEPNDTIGTAAPVAIDETFEYLTLTPSSDERDYYRFAVKAGVTYTLDIQNTLSCYFDYSVGLGPDGRRATLIPNRTTVVNQLNGNSENILSHVVDEFSSPEDGGALLTVVWRTFGGTCSKYELVIRSSTADGLSHDTRTLEPNDSPSTAAPAEIARPYEGLTLTARRDTADFYVFESTTAGSTYSLELDNAQRCRLVYSLSAQVDGTLVQLLPETSTVDLNGNAAVGATPTFTSLEGSLLLRIAPNLVSAGCTSYGFAIRPLD
jgi:hypothetical protein